MAGSNISVRYTTRGAQPRIAFEKIKEAVLGSEYELSVALVSASEATRITKETKQKDIPSNVLAFPLSEMSGEIILCPATARAQAPEYAMTPNTFLTYLFIHALFHLKGHEHSATMEREEHRIMKQFGLRTND